MQRRGKSFWSGILSTAPIPEGYEPRGAMELLLMHGLDRKWVVPWARRTVAEAWVALRIDFAPLWGESELSSYEKVENIRAAAKLAEREAAMEEELGRPLSREEKLELAESMAVRGFDYVKDQANSLFGDGKGVSRAKESVSLAHACTTAFLEGFDEGKGREIRTWLREHPEEMRSVLERMVDEGMLREEDIDRVMKEVEVELGKLEEEDVGTITLSPRLITDLGSETQRKQLDSLLAATDTALEDAAGRVDRVFGKVDGVEASEDAKGVVRDVGKGLSGLVRGIRGRVQGVDSERVMQGVRDGVSTGKEALEGDVVGKVKDVVAEKGVLERGKEMGKGLYKGLRGVVLSGDVSGIREEAAKRIQHEAERVKQWRSKATESVLKHVEDTEEEDNLHANKPTKTAAAAQVARGMWKGAMHSIITDFRTRQEKERAGSSGVHRVDPFAAGTRRRD